MIKMPEKTAEQDPEAWRRYWDRTANLPAYVPTQSRKDYIKNYHKEYYGKKTEARQLRKLRELMDKYPEQARQYLAEAPNP